MILADGFNSFARAGAREVDVDPVVVSAFPLEGDGARVDGRASRV
jgi:hypothetical protein